MPVFEVPFMRGKEGTSFGIEQVINECGRAEVLEQGAPSALSPIGLISALTNFSKSVQ